MLIHLLCFSLITPDFPIPEDNFTIYQTAKFSSRKDHEATGTISLQKSSSRIFVVLLMSAHLICLILLAPFPTLPVSCAAGIFQFRVYGKPQTQSSSTWLLIRDLFYWFRPSTYMIEGEEFSPGCLAALTYSQPFLTQHFCVPAFLGHCPLKKGSLAARPSALPLAGDKSPLTIAMAGLSDSH